MTQSQSQTKPSFPKPLQIDVIFDTSFLDFLIDFRLKSEPQSELYNFHARFYDPELGRFISHDPSEPILETPLDLNPYSFVMNRPTILVDPDGRKFIQSFAGAMKWMFKGLTGASPDDSDVGFKVRHNYVEAGNQISYEASQVSRMAIVSGGDIIQSVPSVVYDTGAILTIWNPAISRVFTGAGMLKTYLDIKEGVVSTGAGSASLGLNTTGLLIPGGKYTPLQYVWSTGGTLLYDSLLELQTIQNKNQQ